MSYLRDIEVTKHRINMKYRLKSIPTEAIQWDGSSESFNAIQELNPYTDRIIRSESDLDDIVTLNVPLRKVGTSTKVLIGDWIIKSDDYLIVVKGSDFDTHYEECVNKQPEPRLTINIPSWEEADKVEDSDKDTPMHVFIRENEPAGDVGIAFRKELQDLLSGFQNSGSVEIVPVEEGLLVDSDFLALPKIVSDYEPLSSIDTHISKVFTVVEEHLIDGVDTKNWQGTLHEIGIYKEEIVFFIPTKTIDRCFKIPLSKLTCGNLD